MDCSKCYQLVYYIFLSHKMFSFKVNLLTIMIFLLLTYWAGFYSLGNAQLPKHCCTIFPDIFQQKQLVFHLKMMVYFQHYKQNPRYVKSRSKYLWYTNKNQFCFKIIHFMCAKYKFLVVQ